MNPTNTNKQSSSSQTSANLDATHPSQVQKHHFGKYFSHPFSTRYRNIHAGQHNGKDLHLDIEGIVGKGSFGVVYKCTVRDSKNNAAVKKVLQDPRFKNRELSIMRLLDHPNIVKLHHFFYSTENKDQMYLNLVLEYMPETLYRVARHYSNKRQTLPTLFIRLYAYQLARSLNYIHSLGICHRDIKPQNLLLHPVEGTLKLCDFGSAKILVPGDRNVSYICSRYYRAPELIFGSNHYTPTIDIWSFGCVLAELMLGQPLFPGDSAVDQLVEIIKVLGTPTVTWIREMNPKYTDFTEFPHIPVTAWPRVFHSRTNPLGIDLVSKLLVYSPSQRLTPLQAMAHPFFDQLRKETSMLPGTVNPDGTQTDKLPLPPLFNFTVHELKSIKGDIHLLSKLVPPHLWNAASTPALKELGIFDNYPSHPSVSTPVSTTSSLNHLPEGSPMDPPSKFTKMRTD